MPANPYVLVVEDSPVIVELVKVLLLQEGFDPLIAEDGRQAQDIVSQNAPPVAVILDIMLPYVDGFEILRQIRGQKGWERVPIIMLTAKSQEKDMVHALDLGADDYIVKPFRPAELAARLRRHIKVSS